MTKTQGRQRIATSVSFRSQAFVDEIDRRAAELGLRRSDYIRRVIEEDLKHRRPMVLGASSQHRENPPGCTGDSTSGGHCNPATEPARQHAASYMLAADQDAARVALQLGHSQDVLMRVYRELVRPADAAAYWSIVPPIRESA